MKNRILIGIASCILSGLLIGCENTTTDVKIATEENAIGISYGIDSLIGLGNGLWYDRNTNIVYWWNGSFGCDYMTWYRADTTPTVYYAPNGFPYKYNPETGKLEEIINEQEKESLSSQNTSTEEPDLKPCPVCENEVKLSSVNNSFRITCDNFLGENGCGLTTGFYDTKNELINMWNGMK